MQKAFYGRCNHCNGGGKAKTTIDSDKVLNIALQNMSNKIDAIKEVRTLYPILGLKNAKDLVEHSMEYVISIHKSFTEIESYMKEVTVPLKEESVR